MSVVLTLIYPDTTRFIVGGFNSSDDANAWVANEQTKYYWVEGTTIQIV